MKLLVPILSAVASAAVVTLVGVDVAHSGKTIVKTRRSSSAQARARFVARQFSAAVVVWREQRNPKRAAVLIQRIVDDYKDGPMYIPALAEAYAQSNDYKKALETYRKIFVYPHSWSSSEEQNLSTIGAYRDVARKLGSGEDVARANRLLLDNYRPLGDEPPLFPPDSSPKTLDAYADAVLALNRGEHRNGVAEAERAVKLRPGDLALEWIAGTVLYDAQRYEEAKKHLLIVKRFGKLGRGPATVLDNDLIIIDHLPPTRKPRAKPD